MAKHGNKGKRRAQSSRSRPSTNVNTLVRRQADYQTLATVEQRTEIARLLDHIDYNLEVMHLVTRNVSVPMAHFIINFMFRERSLKTLFIEQFFIFSLIFAAYPAIKFLKSRYIMPNYHVVDATMPNMTMNDAYKHINILSRQLKSLESFSDNTRYIIISTTFLMFIMTSLVSFDNGTFDTYDEFPEISHVLSMLKTLNISTGMMAIFRAVEAGHGFYEIKQFSEQIEHTLSNMLKFTKSVLIKTILPEEKHHNGASDFPQHIDNPFWEKRTQVFLRIDYRLSGTVPPLLLVQLLTQQWRRYFPQVQILMAGKTQMSMSFSRKVTLVTQAVSQHLIQAFERDYSTVAERYQEFQQIKSILLMYFSAKRMSSTYVLCELVGNQLYLNINTRSYEVAQHLSALLEQDASLLAAEDAFSTWRVQTPLSPDLLQRFKQAMPAPVMIVPAPSTSSLVSIPVGFFVPPRELVSLPAPLSPSSTASSTSTILSEPTVSASQMTSPKQPKLSVSRPSNKDVSGSSLWMKQRLPVFKAMQQGSLAGQVLYHIPKPQFDGNYAVLTLPTTVPDYPMFVHALDQASRKSGRFGLALGKITDHKAEYYGLMGKTTPDGQKIKSFYEIHTPGDTRVIGYEIERNADGKRLIHFCLLAENVHSRPILTDYSAKPATSVLTNNR